MPGSSDYRKTVFVPETGLPVPPGEIEPIPASMQDRIEHVLIPAGCLQRRVRGLAEQMGEDLRGRKRVAFLVVLKGPFMFAADLGRAVYRFGGPEIAFYFIRVSTYGRSIERDGRVRGKTKILLQPGEIREEDLVIIEDIVDQGSTLSAVRRHLAETGRTSARFCALLDKRLEAPCEAVRKQREELRLDYVGFEIPDRWVAGYGIDAGEDFRFLPFIVVVREDYYRPASP